MSAVEDAVKGVVDLAETIFDETFGALIDSLVPDAPDTTDTQSLLDGLQKGIDLPRRITLGRDKIGGVIAHQETVVRHDKEFIQLVVLISGAPIDALEEVYVAGEPISSYDNSSWSYSLSDGYHTTANAMAMDKMQGWTSEHVGYEQAHVFIEFENNSDVFTDGIGDVAFLIRGCRVFDPRDESQLADDRSTWKWSDNAILNTLHYMRFYGAYPVPIERLPLNWWVAAINICDELVTYQDSTGVEQSESRYCVNGTFLFTSNPLDVLAMLESCFAGKVFRQMGAWYVRVGAWYGTPTYTIEQNDVHGNVKIKWHSDLRSRANVVRATFTDPAQDYETTDATPAVSELYKTTDGQLLEKTMSLPFVRSDTQAQRLAVITLEQSRLGGIEIPLKSSGLKAAVGQTIYVNLPNHGIVNKVYRVTDRRFRIDGGVTVVAIEDSVDLWQDSLETATRDLTPNSSYSVGGLLAPTSVDVSVDDNRITVSWTHPAPKSTSSYDVTIYNGDVIAYKVSSEHESIILPTFDTGNYVVSVLAKNIFGKKSAVAASQFTIVSPVSPSINIINVADDSFSLNAISEAVGLSTTYLWQFLGEEAAPLSVSEIISVRADAFSYNGLKAETNYSVRCKSVSVVGESDWVSIIVSTLSYQDVFEYKNIVIPTSQLAQEAQEALDVIPNIQLSLDETLTAFSVNNSSVVSLKQAFSQVGLDITQSYSNLSNDFAHLLESFTDTNQFVFEINEVLGTLLVEGGKVSFDSFTSYQLKVDTFEGQLSSVSSTVSRHEQSLIEAHSLINQNSESLSLLVGSSLISDTVAIVEESSIRLSNVENNIVFQSLAVKAADYEILNALLKSEISAIELIESQVDVAISNEKRETEIDDLNAKASVVENVVASLKDSLAFYSKSVDVTASINRAAALFSEQLTAKINDLSSGYSKDIKVISDENTAIAQRTEILESKVNLRDDETVTSVAQSIANARVSYCSIGRDSDGNIISNANDCDEVGGEWIDNAPISELLYAAKVTNKSGNSVSALSYLTALEDENGKLKARAFFGVDAEGKSGILVFNSSTNEYEHTTLDLTADNILFRSTNGDTIVRLNTETGNLIIDAEIVAKKLTLSDGEVYNRAELVGPKGDTPTVTNNNDGTHTIQGQNGSITISNGENAPIPNVTNNNDGTYTVDDGAGNSVIVSDGKDGHSPIEGVDYTVRDGVNGNDGSYVSYVYKLGSGTPTGGSFNGTSESIPTGWSDNPVFEEGKTTYISTARYTHDGNNWTKGSWSAGVVFSKQGPQGDDGLLPPPTSSPGLFADNSTLGFHNGSSWKTYIDKLGNFFAGSTSDNGYIRWYESLKSLSIKGVIYATGGVFDNVTINKNCTVLGDISGASGSFKGDVSAASFNGLRLKLGSFVSTSDSSQIINITVFEGRIYDVTTGTYTNKGTTDAFTRLIGVSLSAMGPSTSNHDQNFPRITGSNSFTFNRDNGFNGTEYFSFIAWGI